MSSHLAGDWSHLVVVCGAVPWHGTRMLDQHLALGLARYGPVLYVDTAVPRPGRRPNDTARADHRGSGPSSDLQLLAPGLALVTPHVMPGHQRPGMKRVSVALVRHTMRQAIRDLGSPSVRAVIVTSLDACFGACGEQRKVFYASDDYVAGAELMQISVRHLEREMRRRPSEADLVVAASPALAGRFRSDGFDSLLLPNGCDPQVFAATDDTDRAADLTLPGPVAGFMGHLSERIDVRYLDAIARRGHDLLLVGPGPRGGLGEDLGSLVRRPNVQWVGPQEFERLPSYLRGIDLGLVPYTDTPFNHASFPLKALEYLAAGRPVLSTDIDAIHWLRQGHNVGLDAGPPLSITDDDIMVMSTPEAFADGAEQLMGRPRDEEAVARRQAFARAHSWDQRFAVLADALGLDPVPGASEQMPS